MSGRFIVLEGLDGTGKSTQAALLAERLQALGRTVLHTREPGGTRLGERVRTLLLDPDLGEISGTAEVLLYQAARAQLVREAIRPALARGEVVVCERWHYATSAYQTAGFRSADGDTRVGADPSDVAVTTPVATGGLAPDRALLLDLPADAAAPRVSDDPDRIEQREGGYREAVRATYLALFEADPALCRILSAEGTPAEVHARVWEAVRDLFA